MKPNIRKYNKADIANIGLLLEELSGNTMNHSDTLNRLNMIENSGIDSLYVCEEENKLIGVLAFSITLPSTLYVLVKNTEQISQQWEQASEISLFLQAPNLIGFLLVIFLGLQR